DPGALRSDPEGAGRRADGVRGVAEAGPRAQPFPDADAPRPRWADRGELPASARQACDPAAGGGTPASGGSADPGERAPARADGDDRSPAGGGGGRDPGGDRVEARPDPWP